MTFTDEPNMDGCEDGKIINWCSDFAEEFEKRKGSYVCRDILGCDLRTEEGKNFALSNGMFRTLCPEMVRTAAEILTEMLGGES